MFSNEILLVGIKCTKFDSYSFKFLARDAQAKLALIVAQIYPSVHPSVHLSVSVRDSLSVWSSL